MGIFEKGAKRFADFVYKNFETKGSGVMIILTSMTGVALSSLAQTGAILFNSKYTPSQKAFMIPQELTEGCISILSMLLITTPLQKIAKKAVSSGKIRSKELTVYMKKYNLFDKKGTTNFDFSKKITDITEEIKKSDEFIKATNSKQESLLNEHSNIMNKYNAFEDATSAIVTTAGSVFATALVSPLVRNCAASYYQKVNLDVYNNMPQELKDKHKKFLRQSHYFKSNFSLYNPYKL